VAGKKMDSITSNDEIVPLYFGKPGEELYGCHHLPRSLHGRQCGVVLCYPFGHEYIRVHRAFYQIAMRLSQLGFHVLRFDYFGCGDSSGDFEQGTVLRWITDIHASIKELQVRSGLSAICLIGIRFGATLALQAACYNSYIEGLVLWEPIFNGELYIKELFETHRLFVEMNIPKGIRSLVTSIVQDNEVVGYPVSSQLKQDIQSIRIEGLDLNPNMKILTVCNKESVEPDKERTFAHLNPQPNFQEIADHRVWTNEVYKRLIPLDTINFIVNWVDKVC
jgi:pimeloyl-ACP methyl ester carboxylesterase